MFGVFKHLNFWEAVALAKDSGGGGGGSDDKPKRRPSGGKGTKPTVKSTASSLATDIKMGLSTFGQSKEQQAQTFRDEGYSERAIQSYQERSAASLARAKAEQDRISKSDSGSSSTTTTDTSTGTDTDTTATTTGTDTVLDQTTDAALDAVEDISTQTFTDSADFTGNVTAGASVGTAAGGVEQYEAAKETSVGQAEDEALELMKKGRRSTILTRSGGLLGPGEGEGKTRRRRSLIGG
jgi:CO/xanthine dehydrogenase Mo-binding subunit